MFFSHCNESKLYETSGGILWREFTAALINDGPTDGLEMDPLTVSTLN